MHSDIDQAIAEWRKTLPADAVLTGNSLNHYRMNCLSLARAISAGLLPASENDVVGIVKVAAQYKVALYALSTGHNWGYGTSLPVVDNCVIVDLSRMNRILSMDPDLGLVTLEPGVTQKQLFDYLCAAKLNFFVPTTGAGPTASLLGNALERGFGMTPQEDHFTAVTSIRAVLPDGSLFQPYMSERGSPAADGVYKWGLGPYLDGLFTQSGFGIVTAMQIALTQKPEHVEVYLFTKKQSTSLAQLMDCCRGMLADLRGPIGGIKFLNQKQMENTLGSRAIAPGFPTDYDWVGLGVIHCKRSMVRALRRAVREALLPQVTCLRFFNDHTLVWLRRLAPFAPGPLRKQIRESAAKIKQILHIMHGEPRGLELRLAYRYVTIPGTQPLDPIRDGVGLIWYAPVLPLKGEIVAAMVAMIEETLGRYGFEKTVSLTTLSSKCAIGVIPVIYRKPEEQEQAHRCFQELWRRGEELGCPPYRLPISAMAALTGDGDSIYFQTVSKLKSALDPNGIFSPGRYAPVPK